MFVTAPKNNNLNLRKKLQNIIRNITNWNDLVNANMELRNQIISIRGLSAEHPHSISVVKEARGDDPSSYKYTCFMYAFDLMDHAELNSIARGSVKIFPKGEFVSYLIGHFLNEIHSTEAKDGDHIVYFRDGKPVHAGKCYMGVVISKWGMYSHLWRHATYEVPADYGEEVRFFKKVPKKRCMEAFSSYARTEIDKSQGQGPQ